MWVLPTYGRPERCQAALDSIAASGGSSRGIVVIDGDPDLRYAALKLPLNWIRIWPAENIGVCAVLNQVLQSYPDEPWYGFISDDSIVRTPGFEAPLVAAAGRSGFANSADGWQAHRRMHGAVMFGGDLLRALGWWTPPGLRHSFVDDAWEWLGNVLGNWKRVPQVMVEHCHARNGKAAEDATYHAAYESFDADKLAFAALRRGELPAAAVRAIPIAVGDDPVRCRLARARSRHVMIATPSNKVGPAWDYTLAYAATNVHLDITGVRYCSQFVFGSSDLPRSRNELVARFLASDCTDLIFIDDDMGWQPEAIVRLLASDKQVLAGVGRKRVDKPNTDPEVWCVRFAESAEHELNQDDMGAIEVVAVGTGLMKIERTVFEKMIAAHPEWKRRGHDGMSEAVKASYHQFFAFDTDEEVGEDFTFCNRWRALGGSIWIDPTITLSHVGTKAWTGCISELMRSEPAEAEPVAHLEAAE